MLPLELKLDKDGLLYTDDLIDRFSRLISIDKRKYKNEFYASYFCRLKSTMDYIIKQPVTILTRKERIAYKELLIKLLEKQKEIVKTEFPIGYVKDKRKLSGLIIRYYKDGISLENVIKEQDLMLFGKYYYHDEDDVHNLFLIFDEIISILYELFEHEVYYTDINPGNFIIDDNQIRLIDFDPKYVTFNNKDLKLTVVLERYIDLINLVLKDVLLPSGYNESIHNFEEAKVFTKKIENEVRKNR